MASSATKSKFKNGKPKRSLNALAIAEQQNLVQSKLRLNRLSEIEQGVTKRKREDDQKPLEQEDNVRHRKKKKEIFKDRFANEIEVGSDSDGNEWMIGHVDSDDDSDLDSDVAMGESDEDKFENFTFGGSSTARPHKKRLGRSGTPGSEANESQSIDLHEDQSSLGPDEDTDGLETDAIDLAAMLDAGDNGTGVSPRTVALGSHGYDDFSTDTVHHEGSESASDDENSMLSLSDTEIDATNPDKLASLQALVSSMDSRKSNLSVDNKPLSDFHQSATPSEFGLSSTQKLTVADLIPSITDPQLKKSLKLLAGNDSPSSRKRSGIPKKLGVPLAKRQQDLLDREAAYAKSKEVLNRWIDTVKYNRRAEHLSFPIQDPNSVAPQGTQRLLPRLQSQPAMELENVIQSILQDSGLAPTNSDIKEDQVQAFEELPRNELSLNEVQARRVELRRARELLFREETRAKRIKRIKSKSYRRIHRKERERKGLLEKEALLAAGVVDSESEQERNDRRRAEERMGARHRESKWGRSVKDSGRAAWDEDARGGVTEMARRGEELRRRLDGDKLDIDESDSGPTESDSDNVEDGASDIDRKEAGSALSRLELVSGNDDAASGISLTKSNLSSLKFMKNAEALRKARNDADVEVLRKEIAGEQNSFSEEDVEGAGRRLYGPTENQPSPIENLPNGKHKSEFEEKAGSDVDEEGFEELIEGNEQEIIVSDGTRTQQYFPVKNVRLSRKHESHQRGSAKGPISETIDNPWLSTKKQARVTDRKSRDSHEAAIISNDFPADKISAHNGETKLRSASGDRSTKNGPKTSQAEEASLSIQNFESDSDDDEAHEQPFVMRNQDLVRKAFAGDDVVAHFQKEKQETMVDEEEKTVDNTLPGWGNWIGAGISKKEQKRNRGKVLVKVDGIQKGNRQDAKLDRVIINEKRVKKVGHASRMIVPFSND